jgi:hypothetical protein
MIMSSRQFIYINIDSESIYIYDHCLQNFKGLSSLIFKVIVWSTIDIFWSKPG